MNARGEGEAAGPTRNPGYEGVVEEEGDDVVDWARRKRK
jgi:hypothetical protein